MVERADTGVPVGELAGIGLHIRDELHERLRRHGWMHRQREGGDRNVRNRLQLLERIIEWSVLEQGLGDVGRRAAEEDGVAVRASAGDRGGAERTAAAALVLDHDSAEQRLDLFSPRPADGVEPAAWRKRNHEPDRPRRIDLRPRYPRHGWQRGSASGQMQEFAAGKFHWALPRWLGGRATPP